MKYALFFLFFYCFHITPMELQTTKSIFADKSPQSVIDLLQNNGKYLKHLVTQEINGIYSPDLHRAQHTLQILYQRDMLIEAFDIDRSTRHLVACMVTLEKFQEKLFSAIDTLSLSYRTEEDPIKKITTIFKANPYTLKLFYEYGRSVYQGARQYAQKNNTYFIEPSYVIKDGWLIRIKCSLCSQLEKEYCGMWYYNMCRCTRDLQ